MFNIQDYWKSDIRELELRLKDGNKLTVFIGDLNEAYCLTVTDKQDNLILDGASFFDEDESGNYIMHELTNDVLNDMLCDLGVCYVEGYSCSTDDIEGLWLSPARISRLAELIESYILWHNTHDDYFTYYYLFNGKYVGIWVDYESRNTTERIFNSIGGLAKECFDFMFNCEYFADLDNEEIEDRSSYEEWYGYYFRR